MKNIKKIVSVLMILALMLSLVSCNLGRKVAPISKKEFKDAVCEAFDCDDDEIYDYDLGDRMNYYYYSDKIRAEIYLYDDEDDALDDFEDLYDDFKDMIDDKDFDGSYKYKVSKKSGNILLNGNADADFHDGDIYGGFFWTEDCVVVVYCMSDKDKYTEQIDAFLDEIEYPKP